MAERKRAPNKRWIWSQKAAMRVRQAIDNPAREAMLVPQEQQMVQVTNEFFRVWDYETDWLDSENLYRVAMFEALQYCIRYKWAQPVVLAEGVVMHMNEKSVEQFYQERRVRRAPVKKPPSLLQAVLDRSKNGGSTVADGGANGQRENGEDVEK